MQLDALTQVVTIVTVAMVCQLVAWRINFPSIVFLLAAGVILGPVLGLVEPEQLFGNLLQPFVSISVAFILFEGGMSLKFRDAPQIGVVVGRLISVGALVVLVLGTLFGTMLLPIPAQTALLLAGMLMVTGPTVIAPLLRTMRPRSPLGPLLHWEGILIDPVGVVVSVLIAEGIIEGSLSAVPASIVSGLAWSLLSGLLCGVVGGVVMITLLRRHLLPDELHVPLSLLILFLAYQFSETIHHESGLIAAIVLGTVLVNKGSSTVHHLIEFSESIQRLILPILFVVLSARLSPEHLNSVSVGVIAFIAVLIVVVRPLSVFISTLRSKLDINEKVVLACTAPRGIVAASLASVLSKPLIDIQFPGAELIVPYVFITIMATVVFYAIASPIVCALLGVQQKNPQGILIVGAHGFGRALGYLVQQFGLKVVLVDTNRSSVMAARRQRLNAYVGNILSETLQEELDYDGLGRVVALTGNDEANALVAVEYSRIFGRRSCFQLQPISDAIELAQMSARGRTLFFPGVAFDEIEEAWSEGSRLKVNELKDDMKWQEIADPNSGATVIGVFDTKGVFTLAVCDTEPRANPGDKVIWFKTKLIK